MPLRRLFSSKQNIYAMHFATSRYFCRQSSFFGTQTTSSTHFLKNNQKNSKEEKHQRNNFNKRRFSCYYFNPLVTATILKTNGDEKNSKNGEKSKKPFLLKSAANAVTIYIWHQKGTNVGHVAMRTYSGGESGEGIYASFWPTEDVNKYNIPRKLIGKFGQNGLSTYDLDVFLEGRKPDEMITLYSLNVKNVNSAFKEFIDSGYSWALLASVTGYRGSGNIDSENNSKKIANCVMLASFLLDKGGFYRQYPEDIYVNPMLGWSLYLGALIWVSVPAATIFGLGWWLFEQRQFTTTVNDIAEAVKVAQKKELTKYDLIDEIIIPVTTSPNNNRP